MQSFKKTGEHFGCVSTVTLQEQNARIDMLTDRAGQALESPEDKGKEFVRHVWEWKACVGSRDQKRSVTWLCTKKKSIIWHWCSG